MQRFAVHAAHGVVNHAADAAARELKPPSVRQDRNRRERVGRGLIGCPDRLAEIRQRHAEIFAAHSLTAVESVVLQLLPEHGARLHRHHAVIQPAVAATIRRGKRELVARARDVSVRVHDGAVRFSAHAGEVIVPDQRRVVQRLAVVAVFDVEIRHVRFCPAIEGEVVLADDADLRNGFACVDAHPVVAVVAVDRERLRFVRRDVVELRPRLPDVEVSRFV